MVLPPHLEKIRDRLAENIHELWGMNKIELGWTFGKVCVPVVRQRWRAGLLYYLEGFFKELNEEENLLSPNSPLLTAPFLASTDSAARLLHCLCSVVRSAEKTSSAQTVPGIYLISSYSQKLVSFVREH